METVRLTARRYTDRNNNTYFSCICEINDNVLHTIYCRYGYDDHYITVALNALHKLDLITTQQLHYLERNIVNDQIQLRTDVCNVARKKDLHRNYT